MVIPPLDWIYLHPVNLHREVKMIAARQARGSTFSHLLTAAHHLALFHRNLAQVAVDGLQSQSVIQNDAISVDP
jgi:hypothetical protein